MVGGAGTNICTVVTGFVGTVVTSVKGTTVTTNTGTARTRTESRRVRPRAVASRASRIGFRNGAYRRHRDGALRLFRLRRGVPSHAFGDACHQIRCHIAWHGACQQARERRVQPNSGHQAVRRCGRDGSVWTEMMRYRIRTRIRHRAIARSFRGPGQARPRPCLSIGTCFGCRTSCWCHFASRVVVSRRAARATRGHVSSTICLRFLASGTRSVEFDADEPRFRVVDEPSSVRATRQAVARRAYATTTTRAECVARRSAQTVPGTARGHASARVFVTRDKHLVLLLGVFSQDGHAKR